MLEKHGGPGRTRTCNQTVMSEARPGNPERFWRKSRSVETALAHYVPCRFASAGSLNPKSVRKAPLPTSPVSISCALEDWI